MKKPTPKQVLTVRRTYAGINGLQECTQAEQREEAAKLISASGAAWKKWEEGDREMAPATFFALQVQMAALVDQDFKRDLRARGIR